MQAVAFILATLVLVPYAILALAFVLFSYAVSGGTLGLFCRPSLLKPHGSFPGVFWAPSASSWSSSALASIGAPAR
jgi:hypothetical protein